MCENKFVIIKAKMRAPCYINNLAKNVDNFKINF